jgi:SOS response regulatory protein OraA/RecX
MNEQQLIKLLESAEGTIARLMLEVNRLSKELEQRDVSDEEIERIAGSIFTEDQTYQYSDVYKFAKALLQKAKEK